MNVWSSLNTETIEYCSYLGQRILVTFDLLTKLTLNGLNENLWGHLRDWSIRKKEQIVWDFHMEMQGMIVKCLHALISAYTP